MGIFNFDLNFSTFLLRVVFFFGCVAVECKNSQRSRCVWERIFNFMLNMNVSFYSQLIHLVSFSYDRDSRLAGRWNKFMHIKNFNVFSLSVECRARVSMHSERESPRVEERLLSAIFELRKIGIASLFREWSQMKKYIKIASLHKCFLKSWEMWIELVSITARRQPSMTNFYWLAACSSRELFDIFTTILHSDDLQTRADNFTAVDFHQRLERKTFINFRKSSFGNFGVPVLFSYQRSEKYFGQVEIEKYFAGSHWIFTTPFRLNTELNEWIMDRKSRIYFSIVEMTLIIAQ